MIAAVEGTDSVYYLRREKIESDHQILSRINRLAVAIIAFIIILKASNRKVFVKVGKMGGNRSNFGYKKHSKQAVTQLLKSSQTGNKEAVNELLPLLYDEMCSIAHQKLRFERNSHTLDTTALVHETYFKLINHEEVEWQSRTHFLAISALAMKRILINYAEKHNAVKRGGEFTKVELKNLEGSIESMTDSMADEILALNTALERMKSFNERGYRVVEYHYFGGLTWKEISEVMGIAPITVRRSWNVSKLWLRKELSETAMPTFTVKSR